MVPVNGVLEQRYSIQVLRAVAASTVVYLHTFTAPLFGLFGVDLFFVISGFVMCMLVEDRNPRPAAFLIDRVTRIVPLYWAVTTMVLIVAWAAPGLMGTTVANLQNYILSLLFVPHFREDGQLFPKLMVGWSLNYEMVYYAVICFALVINKARFKWLLSAALLTIYFGSDVLDESTAMAQFLNQTVWLEFILGVLCFEIHRHPLLQRVPRILALLFVVLAYLSMVVMENDSDRLFTAGVPSFFMLLFALRLEGDIRRLHASVRRFIVHLGDASYSTYLTHMFVIGFVERIVFVRFGIEKDLGTALFTLVCCLVVGSMIYRLLDVPLTRRARALARMIAPLHVLPRSPGSSRP